MWEPPQKNISSCVNGSLRKSSIKNQKRGYYKWSWAPPEKQWKLNPSWKVISLSLYPDCVSWKWDELIQTIIFTGSDLNEHCKIKVNWWLEVNIYQNKNHTLKRKTSSVLFYTLVYKTSLPLSCDHWMLCITLLWHDLKPYCSSHVTFHCFSL